ncbi:MAG: response regulator [Candidatus Manganitrophus sp.]|nr:response regulator [Candidatus Manganitrophus sp.]MDC4225922.1 response regulator [Candidatus Manganitrophus sp.]WDT72793.1 MAG: response regulator [Candidatus Manganitrophus sp.]WDT74986.1 MAG: response regulator [Candidatus Manganitrophus sp.]WDT79726.1 MAG: response regulator [Candidatus Manganitrophus sp.]
MNPKKVLIVDDEEFVRQLIQIKLKFCGIETVEAGNGVEAIEKAVSERPDLILLDVMMPKMNGFEACQRLKANQETSHIPIIMLTARGDPSAKERGENAGALEYLTKPFSPQKLAERVLEILKEFETRA